MIYVTDTHSLYWYCTAPKQLSRRVRAIFAESEFRLVHLCISVISVAELSHMLRKDNAPHGLKPLLARIQANLSCEIVPIEVEHVMMSDDLWKVREMHDRFIVATALLKEAPLITTDGNIEASKLVETVW